MRWFADLMRDIHLAMTEVDINLLAALLTAVDFRTPESLGQTLGLSAVDAAARLESLRQFGCELESHPRQGVRLIRSGLGCWADYIESRHLGRLGRKLHVYQRTGSTQVVARRLVDAEGPRAFGGVVVADDQLAGRGRLGRQWVAPPGSALLLTAIVPRLANTIDQLMLASCCATTEATEQLTGVTVAIRWPNDLLVEDRKVAGILIETAADAALIGIGINVHAHPGGPLDAAATHLGLFAPHVDRLHLLDVLLDRLDDALRLADDAPLLDAWRERSCLTGHRITVTHDARTLTGRVVDLDPRHGLMLALDDGPVLTLPAATTSLATP